MVRLLLVGYERVFAALPGFNPTMVRLLRKRNLTRQQLRFWFQSHNGAIAAKGNRKTVRWR